MTDVKENLFVLTPVNFKENKSSELESKPITPSEFLNKYDPLIFCRTCANVDSCLVPIFKDEGLNYNLNQKIEKYLPIQVTEEDGLPLHLCYHCASTLIAWDTLVIGCVEAERKLTLLKNSYENKQQDEVMDDVNNLLNDSIDSDDEPLLTKKTARLTKISEKRDILQEKNDLQLSKTTDIDTEGLMEEPDLSFSTFQHHLTKISPFIKEIVKLRFKNSFCCSVCTVVEKHQLSLRSSLRNQEEKYNSRTESFKVSNGGGSSTVSETGNKKIKSGKSQVSCENCGKILSCKLSLKNHMKTHDAEKTLTCHVCGKAFRHRFNLLRHLKVVHEGVRNHVCAECGKKFRSYGEMEDHRNIHNIRQKIICEECGKVFLTKASFYAHRKSHRRKSLEKPEVRFSCGECSKKFTTKKSRNQHMLIHTGEKPIVCNTCGKKFRTKANFSQHAKVHSNSKPFGCEFCGKGFGRKDHLRIHIRSHTGEKPFACDYCGRAFAQLNDMKKHAKLHQKRI